MNRLFFILLMASALHGRASDLFINAGYQDLHMWAAQETFFKKFYKVVLIDMPGHGLTTGVDTNLAVKDVIRTVMDSLHGVWVDEGVASIYPTSVSVRTAGRY